MTEETKRTPPAIVRRADIVVESSRVDSYGNLIVLDKAGKEHRVSMKRKVKLGQQGGRKCYIREKQQTAS